MALGATAYSSVTWTTGDTLTEAKLDAMVANDQAYDAHASNGYLSNNNIGFYQKNTTGTNIELMNINGSDVGYVGNNSAIDFGLKTRVNARAYLAASQNDLVTDEWTKVTLNTEVWDIGADFDTTTNYRFTAPVTGYYLVEANLRWVTGSLVAGKIYSAGIYKDSLLYKLSELSTPPSGDIALIHVLGDIIQLNAGQYLELHAKSAAGVNTVDINGGLDETAMAVHLLSIA